MPESKITTTWNNGRLTLHRQGWGGSVFSNAIVAHNALRTAGFTDQAEEMLNLVEYTWNNGGDVKEACAAYFDIVWF
jgi:hypothetical protein